MSNALEDIQDDLIERLHAGETIDREAVVAAHPEHAQALGGFFVLLDEIERVPTVDGPQPARLGEFTILREIGRGGMGVVYEAEQASLRRRVALKVLPPALGRDEQIVARFQREAESAGRLRHPNIVPVFSVGEAAGTPFFAMELVEGQSLAQVLSARRNGEDAGLPKDAEAWRTWAVQTAATLADALAYAHQKGILHRDIKPGNVILDDKGAPRLTDFGLALDMHAGALTVSGESLGTPQYMSPEQLVHRAQAVDARADIYSLGVTLYELLTLRLPYEADSTAELFAALQSGTIVPPRAVVPDLDPDLEAVLLRALQVDPADRYADAGAFATDLRAVLAHQPIAPAPRRRRKRQRWSPRARLWAIPMALAATALFAGVLLVLTRDDTPPSIVPPSAPTALDWERLATGNMGPDPERTLRRWLRAQVKGRPYRLVGDVRGDVPLRVDRMLRSSKAEAKPVVLLVKRERQVNGRWTEVERGWVPINADYAPFVPVAFKQPRTYRVLTGPFKAGEAYTVEYRVYVHLMLRPPGWGKGERMADHWKDIGAVAAEWTDKHTYQLVREYPADYPAPLTGPIVEQAEKLIEALKPRVEINTRVLSFPMVRFDRPQSSPKQCIGGRIEVLGPDGTLLGKLTGWSIPRYPFSSDTWARSFNRQELHKDLKGLKSVRLRFIGEREYAIRQGEDIYWAGTLEMDVPVVKVSK